MTAERPKRQPKAKFKSRYTDRTKWLTAAQYLAEMMCERQAAKNGDALPARFWAYADWKKEWVKQAILANKWLKKYSVEAILAALQTYKGKKLYSFGGAKFLEDEFKAQQTRLAKQVKEGDVHTLPVNVDEKPRDVTVSDNKKSLSARLRGL